jgi:hypothetical protein
VCRRLARSGAGRVPPCLVNAHLCNLYSTNNEMNAVIGVFREPSSAKNIHNGLYTKVHTDPCVQNNALICFNKHIYQKTVHLFRDKCKLVDRPDRYGGHGGA